MVNNFKQALDYRKGKGNEGTTTERDSSPVSAFVSSLFMVRASMQASASHELSQSHMEALRFAEPQLLVRRSW